jgi:hypothetical protein
LRNFKEEEIIWREKSIFKYYNSRKMKWTRRNCRHCVWDEVTDKINKQINVLGGVLSGATRVSEQLNTPQSVFSQAGTKAVSLHVQVISCSEVGALPEVLDNSLFDIFIS